MTDFALAVLIATLFLAAFACAFAYAVGAGTGAAFLGAVLLLAAVFLFVTL